MRCSSTCWFGWKRKSISPTFMIFRHFTISNIYSCVLLTKFILHIFGYTLFISNFLWNSAEKQILLHELSITGLDLLGIKKTYKSQLTLIRESQLYFSLQRYSLHPFSWTGDGQFEESQFFSFRCCYHWRDELGFVQDLLSFYSKRLSRKGQEAFQDSKQSTLKADEAMLELTQRRGYVLEIKILKESI